MYTCIFVLDLVQVFLVCQIYIRISSNLYFLFIGVNILKFKLLLFWLCGRVLYILLWPQERLCIMYETKRAYASLPAWLND